MFTLSETFASLCSWGLLPLFSFRDCIVALHASRSTIHLKLIVVYDVRWDQVSFFFLHEYPTAPRPSMERLYFPHWIAVVLLSYIKWQYMLAYISRLCFNALNYLSFLKIIPYHLDYSSFIVSLEILQYKSSKFVLIQHRLAWWLTVPHKF